MCRVYRVTRGGYYAWKKRAKSKHREGDEVLAGQIHAIFEKSQGTYGSPRVWQVLRRQGICVGEKRVARLMREYGLRARAVKIYRRVPGTHRFFTSIPNRQRKAVASLPNQVWVGDITYLRLGSKWRFLAVVMDKCSRKIVGWAMGDNRDVNLTLKAFNAAVRRRRPPPGLIFHTDRGIEYAGLLFRKRLAELGVIQSMNRPMRMNDNAHMESFFHSFKSDAYHRKHFATNDELTEMFERYLPFYNEERLHSGLGFVSPVQYEQSLC